MAYISAINYHMQVVKTLVDGEGDAKNSKSIFHEHIYQKQASENLWFLCICFIMQ